MGRALARMRFSARAVAPVRCAAAGSDSCRPPGCPRRVRCSVAGSRRFFFVELIRSRARWRGVCSPSHHCPLGARPWNCSGPQDVQRGACAGVGGSWTVRPCTLLALLPACLKFASIAAPSREERILPGPRPPPPPSPPVPPPRPPPPLPPADKSPRSVIPVAPGTWGDDRRSSSSLRWM